MSLEQAVDKAISEMPENFEIKRYLKGHQSEVKNMCLTEYDEAETMQLFKEEGREEGREDQLISQICRKLRKGKNTVQIAEDLEEDVARVQAICDVAEEYAPDYDEEKVIDAVMQKALA